MGPLPRIEKFLAASCYILFVKSRQIQLLQWKSVQPPITGRGLSNPCEIRRPGIHFVAVKTVEQQDIKALCCTCQLRVEQRTAAANQIRALAAKQRLRDPGLDTYFATAITQFDWRCGKASVSGITLLHPKLLENIHTLNESIRSTEYEIAALCQQQPWYPANIRSKVSYITNAIKSIHRQFRTLNRKELSRIKTAYWSCFIWTKWMHKENGHSYPALEFDIAVVSHLFWGMAE